MKAFLRGLVVIGGEDDAKTITSSRYIHVLGAFALVCALVVLSTNTVDQSELTSFVMLFIALGASIALMAHQKTELAVHMTTVSFISLYQLYFYTHFKRVAFAHRVEFQFVELGVALMVVAILAWESALLYYVIGLKHSAAVPETLDDLIKIDAFHRGYGYVVGFLLLVVAFVPFPSTGLFYMPHWLQACMFAIWIAQAHTEFQTKRRVDQLLTTPPIACKCAPLLYLNPAYWAVVLLFILVNTKLLRKTRAAPRLMQV